MVAQRKYLAKGPQGWKEWGPVGAPGKAFSWCLTIWVHVRSLRSSSHDLTDIAHRVFFTKFSTLASPVTSTLHKRNCSPCSPPFHSFFHIVRISISWREFAPVIVATTLFGLSALKKLSAKRSSSSQSVPINSPCHVPARSYTNLQKGRLSPVSLTHLNGRIILALDTEALFSPAFKLAGPTVTSSFIRPLLGTSLMIFTGATTRPP